MTQIDADSGKFAEEKEAILAEAAETVARLEHASEEIETLKVGKRTARFSHAPPATTVPNIIDRFPLSPQAVWTFFSVVVRYLLGTIMLLHFNHENFL